MLLEEVGTKKSSWATTATCLPLEALLLDDFCGISGTSSSVAKGSKPAEDAGVIASNEGARGRETVSEAGERV